MKPIVDSMPPLADAGKRSGRTTRMVLHAVELARQARTVYVCMPTHKICQDWEKWRDDMQPLATSIHFRTVAELDIDWQRMRLRQGNPNCILLVDHFVIDCQFFNVLRMRHAYDERTS